MWYHSQAYFLSTKDVVAAWLVCAHWRLAELPASWCSD